MLLKNNYEAKNAAYYGEARQEMIEFVPTSASRVLEVGCSTGLFGAQLKASRSIEVWGVEPFETAAAQAKQNLDHVICAPFDGSIDLPKASFDCIIFNDVLEHMVDPYKTLDFCKELLCGDSVIVASIPNIRYIGQVLEFLVKKDWHYQDFGILDRTHLRFFTKRSIIRMFQEHGYEIRKIAGIRPTLQNRIFSIANLVLLNQISDMRYKQFAVVAQRKDL